MTEKPGPFSSWHLHPEADKGHGSLWAPSPPSSSSSPTVLGTSHLLSSGLLMAPKEVSQCHQSWLQQSCLHEFPGCRHEEGSHRFMINHHLVGDAGGLSLNSIDQHKDELLVHTVFPTYRRHGYILHLFISFISFPSVALQSFPSPR